MLGHVLRAATVMLIGLAPLLVVWRKFGEGAHTLRRFIIAYVVVVGLVAAISLGSETYETRCPDDPSEFCRYNDSTPFMAVLAVVFVIAGCIRAWMLYAER